MNNDGVANVKKNKIPPSIASKNSQQAKNLIKYQKICQHRKHSISGILTV